MIVDRFIAAAVVQRLNDAGSPPPSSAKYRRGRTKFRFYEFARLTSGETFESLELRVNCA